MKKTPQNNSLVSSPKALFLISRVQIQESNWCLALLLCVHGHCVHVVAGGIYVLCVTCLRS